MEGGVKAKFEQLKQFCLGVGNRGASLLVFEQPTKYFCRCEFKMLVQKNEFLPSDLLTRFHQRGIFPNSQIELSDI